MDKITKTVFLLILIAISLQRYLMNSGWHSDEIMFFAVPITINVLLLVIYITQKGSTSYKNSIEDILMYSLIITTVYFVIFGYLLQLGKAFRN